MSAVLVAIPLPENSLTNGSGSISPRTNTYCRPQARCFPSRVSWEQTHPQRHGVGPTSSPTTGAGWVSGCGHAEPQVGEEETWMTAQPWMELKS